MVDCEDCKNSVYLNKVVIFILEMHNKTKFHIFIAKNYE